MNCTKNQWNSAKTPIFKSTITNKFYMLCWFITVIVLSLSTSAKSSDCPSGDPLQWSWIQNLIEQDGGCEVGLIQQFQYNGDSYISASPGVTENGQPCPSDHAFSRYTCQGGFICSFGVVNGTDCDPAFENAARVGTTIWTYEDTPQTENCPPGDPLQWTWIQNIINQSSGCAVNGIQQFAYNGNDYIRTSPGGFVNGIQCPPDHNFKFYNCLGDFVCDTGVFGTGCDAMLEAAGWTNTPIWTYQDTPIPGSCNTYLGTFFYANCGGINYYFIELEDGRIFDPYFAVDPGYYPEEGQQIRFDFEIKTDVATPCTISESPITITCFEPYESDDEPACDLPLNKGTCNEYFPRYYFDVVTGNCQQFIYSGCGGNANNYENYTACTNACSPSINCPAGDPLEWDWLQQIINKDDLFSLQAIGFIQQFEYNGYTYFKTKPADNIGVADFPEEIYDCQGNFICQISIQITDRCIPGDFDYDTAFNAPIIWERAFVDDELACDFPLDEGTCDEYIPRYYFNTEAGVCQSFVYTGCGGNINNYETYAECLNACNTNVSCPDGDPLEWDWMQELIATSDGCEREKIDQFEYNGNDYFILGPGSTCGFQDPFLYRYYDCNGNFICNIGLVARDFPFLCFPDMFDGSQNQTTIWTYEADDSLDPCDLPFDRGAICDKTSTRYYFDAGSGNCQSFNYYGCGGNANNYETYTDCINACNSVVSCPEGDPLQWNWIQNIINGWDACSLGSIQLQEYADGNSYVFIYPGNEPPHTGSGPPPAPCLSGIPIYKSFTCQGTLLCAFEPVHYPPCTIGDLGELVNTTNIWTREFESNEAACELPLVEGTCDEFIPRYYYNAEEGNCQTFIYTGCGGNANNYETYNDCMNACNETLNCPEGDPLEWDWIQDIIANSDGCTTGEIRQFERNGNYYFEAKIGPPCLNYDPLYNRFYDCNGNLICIVGLFPPGFPPTCNPDFFEGTQNHTTIWTYEYDCTNPFESSIVQNAMLDECTEAIFTFDYEGDPYIYIKQGCDYIDVIYDCKTKEICGINTSGISSFSCPSLIESVQILLTDENTIWTNDCTYENTGMVYYSENCGLYIGCCLDSQFVIATLPGEFELAEGQIVEFNYEPATEEICLPLGMPVNITCIRKVADDCGCPPPSKPPVSVCGVDGNTYDSACLANCYANGVAYQGECRDCNSENPLQEDWIKSIIINSNNGCYTNEIQQFTYNEAVYFRTIAGEPGVYCYDDVPNQYYDCFGNLICKTGGVTLIEEWCDPDIIAAGGSGTTIWTYNAAGCQNPLDTDFAQEWINDGCAAESIYTFEYEGETYIFVEPNSFCDVFNLDYYYDNKRDYLFNCNTGIACNPFTEYYYNQYSCYNISESYFIGALSNDNLIWTKPCEYELTGEVLHIGDVIPIEYVYDDDCDLIINITSNGDGFTISPISLPDDFILTEGQIVEFTYRHTYNVPESACSDESPVEIICIREAGGNQSNQMKCPENNTTSICAPVNIPPSLSLQDFSTTDDPNYLNLMSLQMEEQTEVNKYFNTTTRTYTISDEAGNQKTCETKHHIANQFLQMPELTEPGTICEEDLWSYVKIGTDQYKIYVDNNGTKGELISTCNTPSLICSTADFGVDTKIPNTYNFWASTYFEFPNGSICESEAIPFYVGVQAKPVAALSQSTKTMQVGEGMSLMDMATTNKSGYWSGENIVYLMTATGENIAYFSSNTPGAYKLYYTVKNDFCEQSYLLVVEVASAGKATLSGQAQKTIHTSFNIYPNPTNNKVFIDLPDEFIYQISLMDISGRAMKYLETKKDNSIIEMNVNDLPKGMYLVELKNESNQILQKLIIE